MGDLVDLNTFRKQKEEEEAERLRLEKEQQERDEIEQMQIVLINIMEQLGAPSRTGSIFYAPMTDDDYFNNYQFESGYDNNGDWYSSWEADGYNEEDYLYDPEEED